MVNKIEINTPIARLIDLESPHFDGLCLKIYLLPTTIFSCFCYCSPNATDFLSFFEYLATCRESLLTSHLHAEVLYIGDFNVHHTDWLQSTHTVVGGIEAFHFSISNELEQIIKHLTIVPDHHDHAANTLDLFFTSNPQKYTYTVSSPLGSSDHCTVSVTSSFTPPPPIPPTQHHLWHFENAQFADMRDFLLDFPWNDYCLQTRDPDLVATEVGEVMDSGMRAYIPYSLITFSPSNPWFDRACSSAILDREGEHRLYQASPSELTHVTFISASNRCSAKNRRAHSSFRKRKIDKLNFSTEKCFWSLSKKIFNNFCNSSFPSLIHPDGSMACFPTDKVNLFGSYFSTNSSLSDSSAPDPPTQPLSSPTPSISWIERENIDCIKLLLLSSLMLLLFLLVIAVLLRIVGPIHLSVKGKLISSTLLLKNVSGPYPKKSSTTSVTPAFPHLFTLMALWLVFLLTKSISSVLTFQLILLSVIPVLLILLLNPSLALHPLSLG